MQTVRPVEVVDLPVAQAVQDEAPVTAEYLPIPQPVHALETAAAYSPARQVEQVGEAEDNVEYLPPGQAVQEVALAAALYLPEAQFAQLADKPEAYLPAAQAAHVEVLPAELTDPAAQLVQEAAPASEKVPATHVEHSVKPVPVAYLPAVQEIHCVAKVAPTVELALPPEHFMQLDMPAVAW